MVNRKYIKTLTLVILTSILFANPLNKKNTSFSENLNLELLENKDEEKSEEKEKVVKYENTYWELTNLYETEKKWENELKSFEKETKELKNYIGKVTKSKTHLSFALDIKEKLDIKLEKLYCYVKLNQDINKNSYKYLDMRENILNICSDYSKICSDLELEILKLSDEEYKDIKSDKTLFKKYGMYLEEIRLNKEYYLDEKSEEILCDVSKLASLPKDTYDLFRNMDKKGTISASDYKQIIEGNDREARKIAYQNELITYNDNINTISSLLIGQVEKNVFFSTQRGYKSSLDMYLKFDELDTKIYDQLIDTVDKNLGSLHKYITLRKEILNLDKVHSYDLGVPIVKAVDEEISFEKSQGIIYSALSPLGKEYADVMFKAFNEKWIDVYGNENKVGGAYCMSVYGSHPYILLNYNNSLDGVSTLAHEMGHAVYEYLSSKNQNYFNSTPSIFTHEVASITNESLLYESLIKDSKNNEEKAYYITQYLDMIKSTLFIQTMYAEFEKMIHEKVENNESINAIVLDDIWGQLLVKYYGKDYELDQLSKVGWSRIPHFYNSFYVYKYATGCSAGVSFAQKILSGENSDYIDFLKNGSSKYPLQLLQDAGVNLESKQPIEDTIKKFDDLVIELEKLTLQKN